jgi:hypothetical protein
VRPRELQIGRAYPTGLPLHAKNAKHQRSEYGQRAEHEPKARHVAGDTLGRLARALLGDASLAQSAVQIHVANGHRPALAWTPLRLRVPRLEFNGSRRHTRSPPVARMVLLGAMP